VNDSQFPKLETTSEVAATNELASVDSTEARQEKARHAALTVAVALTAIGAAFVQPGQAQNKIDQGPSGSFGTSGGGGFGGGGGGGGGGGSFTATVTATPGTSTSACPNTSGTSSFN
jgi:hypothetical protein